MTANLVAGDGPREGPARAARSVWARLDRVRWLGPGLVMAATAIGASHLILAPTAGAIYGWSLLWLMAFSHAYKYPAFDFGPRYAVATETSLIDGYARVPGPHGWALWVFLLGTVVQGVTVLAGVLSVAAVVIHAAFPISVLAWCVILGLSGAWLLWSGRFAGLSAVSKWMLLVLALMTTVAFAATPPPPDAWVELVRPHLPAGSLVLVAAILGWMPTGIDVAVWHSMWALERREVWAERAGVQPGRARRILATARVDLWIGYGLSLVLAIMFFALGVAVLHPAGLVPQGADVAVTIARLYTGVLGGWALYPFLIAAFFGMVSTTYGVMDGFPRAFADTVPRLWPGAPAEVRLYWGFLWATLALAITEIAILPDPLLLVTVAAVASFLLAPILSFLNYWCVTRLIEEPELRPGRALRVWAIAGILCATAAAGVFLYVQFLG
ncbi:MAG: Nramp family divalent metal transporter [Gemmatimonadota bacterium]